MVNKVNEGDVLGEARELFDKRSWSLVEDISVLDLGESEAIIGEWRGIKALHLKRQERLLF